MLNNLMRWFCGVLGVYSLVLAFWILVGGTAEAVLVPEWRVYVTAGIVALTGVVLLVAAFAPAPPRRRAGTSPDPPAASTSRDFVPCDICILTRAFFHCKVHGLNLCKDCVVNHDKRVCVYDTAPREEVVWR